VKEDEMVRPLSAPTLTLAVLLAAATSAQAQNADNGKTVFKQICAVCHAAVAGKTLIGPTLFGVVGRKSGSVAGYQYSDGNRAANLTWDAATLDRYLADPRGVVPGTKMTYGGLKDDQKRHDVIAYLDTLK
jgi:cytochrome c